MTLMLQGNCKASVEIVVEEVDGEACSWRLMARVGNRMNCQLRLTEGRLSAGPVISTRMMPPPELLQLENQVSHLLSNLTDVQRNGEQDSQLACNLLRWWVVCRQPPIQIKIELVMTLSIY